MRKKAGWLALKVALIYIFVAGTWILFSDSLLDCLVKNHDILMKWSAVKDVIFVIISAGALHLLLRQKILKLASAKEEHQAVQFLYQKLFESMNAGVVHCRMFFDGDRPVDFAYLEVNAKYTELTGLKEVVGKRISELTPDFRVSDPELMEIYGRVAATGRPEKFERYVYAMQAWLNFSVFCPEPEHFVAVFDVINERKRVEAALEESRDRYQALFDRSLDCVFLCDFEGNFLDANQASLRLLGYQREEIPSLNFASLLSADQLPLAHQSISEIIRTGQQQTALEYQLRRKDGGMVHVETRSSLIFRNGRPFAIQGIARDITDRKQAELELVKRERNYREIFNATNDAIMIHDASGRILDVNDAMVKQHGYATKAEYFAAGPEKHFIPDSPYSWEEAMRRLRLAVETGPQVFEWQTRRQNGEAFWAEVSLRSSHIGGQGCILAVVRDIVERKRVENLLRASEERFRALIEAAEIAVFLSLDLKFTYLNPAALKLFRANSPDQLIGQSVLSRIHPDCHDKIKQRSEKVSHGEAGAAPSQEEIYLRLDGSTVIVEAMASPLNIEGRPGAVVFVQDITGRKQAEEMMRASETQFRVMFEMAAIGMAQANPLTKQWIRVNQKMCAITGYTEAELLQMKIEDITLPADRKTDSELFENVVTGGQSSYRLDKRYRRKDGTEVWVNVNMTVIRDAAGRPLRTLAAIEDITIRKLVEEELRWKTAFLEALVYSSSDGILVVDNESRKILQNQRLTDLWQLSPEIVRSQDDKLQHEFARRQVRNPEEFDEKTRQLNASADLNVQARDEVELINGTVLERQTSLVTGRDGKVYGRLWNFRDITERKLSEEDHARLATAVEQSAEAIVITDPAGKIQYINPAFEKTSGYCRAEVLGKNPRILKSDRQDREFYRQLWTTINQGKIWRGHFYNRHKSGTFYEEEVTITPVRDGAGKIVNFVGVKRDLTREVELESQVRQAQKMEAIGRLAGGVAHDFNNILAVIQLQAGMLKTDPTINAGQMEYAKEIEDATNRAAALTKQLLLFSRKQAMQLHHHDLNEVVTSMTKMLQRVLGENIQIQLKLNPQALIIYADSGMIDQVLMNLTVNARDAMAAGGRLFIETSAVDIDEVQAAHLPDARPGAFVCLTVRDTGCGMPPETLTRIYEPFFTTKAHGKGTGLGLATVFGIVQQHQGWINVTSQVGEGTTFQIYLPRRTAAAEDVAEWASLASILRGHETILLVEDDPTLCACASEPLTRHGYRVLEAATGPEALAHWQSHQAEISLLLTDLLLPDGMTGKELAQKILAADPDLKVIYMSGYSADLAGSDFRLDEGINFLAKPFTVHKLTQIVRDTLDSKAR